MTHDALKWNKRASLMYAVGVWTMFGSYGIYRYIHRNDPPVEVPVEEEVLKPNIKRYESPHLTTTVTFKEDFVPYSTRVMNFFKSSDNTSDSDGKSS